MDEQDLERKLQEYHRVSQQIKALEEEKKRLGQELLAGIPQGFRKYQTAHFSVFRQNRISFKTTVEDAALLHAVKTEVVVDKERLKALYEQGHEVPGVSETEYVLVKEK